MSHFRLFACLFVFYKKNLMLFFVFYVVFFNCKRKGKQSNSIFFFSLRGRNEITSVFFMDKSFIKTFLIVNICEVNFIFKLTSLPIFFWKVGAFLEYFYCKIYDVNVKEVDNNNLFM